jgi:hypothetical protein
MFARNQINCGSLFSVDEKHVVSKHGKLPPEPYLRHSESVLVAVVYMSNSAVSVGGIE